MEQVFVQQWMATHQDKPSTLVLHSALHLHLHAEVVESLALLYQVLPYHLLACTLPAMIKCISVPIYIKHHLLCTLIQCG